MPASFLRELFGQKPVDSWVLLWQLKGKTSFFYESIDQAERHVAGAAGQDLYVGVGLSPKDFGRKARCPADQVAGIVGLWADVDVADDVHKKKNLPPSKEAASAFLLSLPLKPTLVVDSGHGLQPWWLFVEPWIFEEQSDRLRAAALSQRWTDTLRAHMQRKGWTLDATQDLARILRIPGTMNCKVKGAEIPVTMLKDDGPRCNPSDFDDHLLSSEKGNTPIKDYADQLEGDLELRQNATPPFDKWSALMEADPKIRKTWERKRKDFSDQSPSTYDMALANYGAMAGWPDQEIADLMIAWRRSQKEDLKLRQDYYARTIAKARAFAESQGDADDSTQVLNQYAHDDAHPVTDDERKRLIDALEKKIGFRFLHLWQEDNKEGDPDFYLSLPPEPGETYAIGNAKTLNEYAMWRDKVNPLVTIPIQLTKKQFDSQVYPILWRIRERRPQTSQTTTEGMVRDYLAYRVPRDVATPGALDAALAERSPFKEERYTYLFLEDLQGWLRKERDERISVRKLGSRLKNAGAELVRRHVRQGRVRTTMSVWELRNGLAPHDEPVGEQEAENVPPG